MSLVHEEHVLPYTCNIYMTELHSFKSLESLFSPC